MKRTPEPEIMADQRQVLAYAKANFSTSNQWFVDHVMLEFPNHLHTVIDLGCGPADVLIRLATQKPDIHITAIDGSAEMIKVAAQAVQAAGLERQISLIHSYLPELPFDEHSFDAILSKDLLHHLPDPMVLWREVKRLAGPGAAVFVMDLFRRETPEDALAVVESVAAHEDPILKEDFYNSLCAAFTPEEVREQLREAGLDLDVVQVSARHMLIKGLL